MVSLLLLRLLNAVELLVHLKELFLGEGDVCHTNHRSESENGEACHHIHKAAACALEVDGEAAALLFALLLILLAACLHLSEETESKLIEPELTSLGFHNVAELVVKREASLGSLNVEPVKNRALLNENVVHVHFTNLADSALVGELACLGNDLGFSYVRNVEVEEVVGGCLLADGLAVNEELYLGKVRVNGNLGHVLESVDISLAAKVNERIVRVEDVTKVTVYSNLPEVELFANGKSLGKKTAADHFFYFDVPNAGETKLVAVAGEFRDESVIRKVDKMNEDYILKEKGAVLNWFDIDAPEGRFSLNDKLADIMATFRGKLWFMKLGLKIKKQMDAGKDGKKEAAGFELGEGVMKMMGGFTVLRLTSMMGMMNVSFTKEELLKMNKQLNRIRKPKK